MDRLLVLLLLVSFGASFSLAAVPAENTPAPDPIGATERGTEEAKPEQKKDEKLLTPENIEKLSKLPGELGAWLSGLQHFPGFEKLVASVPELKKFLTEGAEIKEKDVPAVLKTLQTALLEQLKSEAPKASETPALVEGATGNPVDGDKFDRMPEQPAFTPEAEQGGRKCDGGSGGGHGGGGGGGGRPISSGNLRRGDLAPPSSDPFPTDKLMPAGLKNNPAFEISASLGGGQFGKCQATLVRAEVTDGGTQCSMATAAHCASDDQGRRVQRYKTAYGEVATDRVNLSIDKGTTTTDIGLISFDGPMCQEMIAQNVPVVPIRTDAIQPGDVVYGGTRYFAKLIFGQVTSTDFGTASINYNFNSNGGHQGGIHTGDSGGPLLAANPSTGKLELVGVLSASEREATIHRNANGSPTVGGVEGFYSMKMDFLTDLVAREKRRNPPLELTSLK